jgi:hypothetical protein
MENQPETIEHRNMNKFHAFKIILETLRNVCLRRKKTFGYTSDFRESSGSKHPVWIVSVPQLCSTVHPQVSVYICTFMSEKGYF